MPSSSQTIVGIRTSARQIAVSIFRNRELIFFAIKTIGNRHNQMTLANTEEFIGALLREYDIYHVALAKLIYLQQHRSFLKTIYNRTRIVLKEQGISFIEYDPRTVRKTICESKKPTRSNMARILVNKYPELDKFLFPPKIWQRRYFGILLDAIAAAFVCMEEDLNAD